MKKDRICWWPFLLLLLAAAGCDLFSGNQQPVISGTDGSQSLNPFTVNPFNAINTAIQGTRPHIEPAAGTLGTNGSQTGSTSSTGTQSDSTGSTPLGSTS